MRRDAIAAARVELKELRQHCADLRDATDAEQAALQWSNIVSRAQRIYNKLAAGKNGKSQQWFGQKMAERRDDELLRYVHQARNADEHGVEPLAHPQRSMYAMGPGPGKEVWGRTVYVDGKLQIFMTDKHGNKTEDQNLIVNNYIRLVPVTNYGQTYPTPSRHLRCRVDTDDVVKTAFTVLEYMSQILNEAELYVQS